MAVNVPVLNTNTTVVAGVVGIVGVIAIMQYFMNSKPRRFRLQKVRWTV